MARLLDWWRRRFTNDPPEPDPELLARIAEVRKDAHRLKGEGDLPAAIQRMGEALALRPDDPELHYERGLMHCIAESYRDAIADLDQALRLMERGPDARRARALCERGLAYERSGDWKRALDAYNDATAADPGYPLVEVNRGWLLRTLGRADLAASGIDFALRLEPDQPMVTLAYAECLKAMGEAPKALVHYERFLELTQAKEADPVALAQSNVRQLREAGVAPAPFVLEDHMVNTAWMKPTHTVGQLADAVKDGDAYFVVVEGTAGTVGAPVYGPGALANHLDGLADFVGPSILDLRLEEIHDVFLPVATLPLTASENDARAAATTAGWVLVALEAGETGAVRVSLPQERGAPLRLALEEKRSSWPRWPQTSLFERKIAPPHRTPQPKPPSFRREGRRVSPNGARRCSCGATFSYYRGEVRDGKLADYLCPSCGKSEIETRIEARMRPGAWSRVGFLGAAESLREVRADDARTLQTRGIDPTDIVRRLEELLAAASSWYEMQEGRLTPIALDTCDPPPRPSGAAPELGAGYSDGPFQVVLKVYRGYQHCPFTALRRPYSDEVPGTPIRIRYETDGKAAIIEPINGQQLQCNPAITYACADRDFTIVNRETGAFLEGPGLAVHLIRDHQFFQGRQSPYRIDPLRAVEVLGLGARGRTH